MGLPELYHHTGVKAGSVIFCNDLDKVPAQSQKHSWTLGYMNLDKQKHMQIIWEAVLTCIVVQPKPLRRCHTPSINFKNWRSREPSHTPWFGFLLVSTTLLLLGCSRSGLYGVAGGVQKGFEVCVKTGHRARDPEYLFKFEISNLQSGTSGRR